MKRRFIHVAFTIYILFAIVTASSAVVPDKETALLSAHPQAHVEALPQVAGNHWGLDLTNTRIDIRTPRAAVRVQVRADNERKRYRIVVWTASWCGPCRTYKKTELQTLLKMGYEVEVLDYDRDNPPESITSVPTVVLYYRDKIVKAKTYWKARDLDQFVEGRLTLKG